MVYWDRCFQSVLAKQPPELGFALLVSKLCQNRGFSLGTPVPHKGKVNRLGERNGPAVISISCCRMRDTKSIKAK